MTDSSCDLPAKIATDLDLVIVPLSLSVGGKEYFNYLDERELTFAEFYAILRREKKCTTSAVNVASFQSIMDPILESGKDLIYLAFSSALSNTQNAARIAATELQEKYPKRKIIVIDTLAASLGQGMLVYLTALEKQKGKSIDELRDFAESICLNICHWFTVDDLFHLHSGGRLSKASAVVGSMLNIKPVLHVDDEGKLVNVAKARGTKNAIKALLDRMQETIINPEEQTIFISHGDCLDRANELAELIKQKMPIKDVIINYVGPVIGAHSGPGTLALFYKGTQR